MPCDIVPSTFFSEITLFLFMLAFRLIVLRSFNQFHNIQKFLPKLEIQNLKDQPSVIRPHAFPPQCIVLQLSFSFLFFCLFIEKKKIFLQHYSKLFDKPPLFSSLSLCHGILTNYLKDRHHTPPPSPLSPLQVRKMQR